ncbi:MAG: cation-translocating P-type ATPase [Arcanobacterium sp.]|nr:cation-translocating P-type ATPase [Arcanobacterium sp.]
MVVTAAVGVQKVAGRADLADLKDSLKEEAPQCVAEIDLAISGMTCASCVARVEKKLNKVPGVKAVVNLATEKAHVELAPEAGSITNEELISVVEKAGYGADFLRRVDIAADGTRSAVTAAEAAHAVEARAKAASAARVADLWRRFWVSLILAIPVVAISMVPAMQFPGWQWVIAVPALVIAVYGGWPFHRAAFRAGRHGSSTMDTLVSLGVIASMGWSIWALGFGGAGRIGYVMHMSGLQSLGMHDAAPHIYFESAAMIVSFLLLGRWLEARSRRSAGDALQELLELGVQSVYVLSRADGTEENAVFDADSLHVGDVFLVKPGEKIATDGVVIDGASAVDASLLTGESAPVEVATGSAVTGATLNTYGQLAVRATRVGEETTLAQMGRLLTEAQTGKAPVQRLADRISAVFVPAVLIIAALDFALRLALGNPLEMALTSAITVLVVACPCALGLATPTALLVGSGAASKRGILIAGPEVLETAHTVSVALLDKTGTLTRGVMSVASVTPVDSVSPGDPVTPLEPASPEMLMTSVGSGTPAAPERMRGVVFSEGANESVTPMSADTAHQLPGAKVPNQRELTLVKFAAALEARSEHPIAQAIVKRAQELGITLPAVSDFRAVPGKGVQGTVNVLPGSDEMAKLGTVASAVASADPVAGADFAEIEPHDRRDSSSAGAPSASVSAAAIPEILSHTVYAGTAQWIAELGIDPSAAEPAVAAAQQSGSSAVVVVADGSVLGVIAVADTIRPESAQAMAELKELGVAPTMISGDSPVAATAVARRLGIEALGGVLPSGKMAAVQAAQERGDRVLMAGDGVNDAAALAAADLSIAMGAGTDVAKAAADITIMNSDPRLIPAALRISHRTLRIIKENLAWAFGYNLIAIPLAVAGIIAPGLAAAAMASSSVIVVGNSLRLRSAK